MKKKFNDIIQKLKSFLILPTEIKNDFANRNFSHYRYVNSFILIFGILSEIAIIIIYAFKQEFDLYRILYFGAFILWALLMFIYINIVKNISSKKSLILKNIPAYGSYLVSLVMALYNFYLFDNPITGFLVYFIIGFLSLIIFDYEPFHQFFFHIIPFIFMYPRIIERLGLYVSVDVVLVLIVFILLIFYKRYLIIKNKMLSKKQIKQLKVITFGNFTIIHNNTVLKFQRRKSLELLAYLIYKKGSSVNSKELMCVLWGDRATSSVYGANLRNSIVDIKNALKKEQIEDFFITEYNSFRINPDVVDCDFYNLLKGDEEIKKEFAGEFMNQYSWAEDEIGYIEKLIVSK